MVKLIQQLTNYKILLITYTHHALDDALSHLLNVGVDSDQMVRLGSATKATKQTVGMALSNQVNTEFRRMNTAWDYLHSTENHNTILSDQLQSSFRSFVGTAMSFEDLKDIWEFYPEYHKFYDAFDMPPQENGFITVVHHNKKVDETYLLDQWSLGNNAGFLCNHPVVQNKAHIWSLPLYERKKLIQKWCKIFTEEKLLEIQKHIARYNSSQEELKRLREDQNIHTISNKRIIACTTTTAASYHWAIKAAKPDVLLVEEAGEILEAHILTALMPSMKRLVLIGDHKQLRPKTNNYDLKVEKGDGYNLNISLFERLVIQGMAHATLTRQHRAHPELSYNIRELTYPNLEDGTEVHKLENIKGLQDRLVFINHEMLEDDEPLHKDNEDFSLKTSKRNLYEAEMVIKCVRYLVQQGYKSDEIVVLTPYLGQLLLLRDLLKKDYDPWLDDMDSYELVRKGLIPEVAAKAQRKEKLRVSTIGKVGLPFYV